MDGLISSLVDGQPSHSVSTLSGNEQQTAGRDVHQLLALYIEQARQGVPIASENQIEIAAEICVLLEKDAKFDILESFMQKLPFIREYQKHEGILRAKVRLAVHRKDTATAKALLTWNPFRPSDELIDLWDQLHYIEEEKRIGKQLSPLARFRVRKRNPPPRSICPNGIRKTSSLPKIATKVLRNWLDMHYNDPYPSLEDKHALSKLTGLTVTQVKTWFANARRRIYRRQRSVGCRQKRDDDGGIGLRDAGSRRSGKRRWKLIPSPTMMEFRQQSSGGQPESSMANMNTTSSNNNNSNRSISIGNTELKCLDMVHGSHGEDALEAMNGQQESCNDFSNYFGNHGPMMNLPRFAVAAHHSASLTNIAAMPYYCEPSSQGVYETVRNPSMLYQQHMGRIPHTHLMPFDEVQQVSRPPAELASSLMTSPRHALCYDTPWVHASEDDPVSQFLTHCQLYPTLQQQQQHYQAIRNVINEMAPAQHDSKGERADMDAARILADLSQKRSSGGQSSLHNAVLEHFP